MLSIVKMPPKEIEVLISILAQQIQQEPDELLRNEYQAVLSAITDLKMRIEMRDQKRMIESAA